MLKYKNTSTTLIERVYKIPRTKKTYLHEIIENLYKT